MEPCEMVEVPVYNTSGKKIDTLKVDEDLFGGRVNLPLMKQAIVAYHANLRSGSAHTRGRSSVAGSGRKLFRQKGTGHARRGAIRTNIMRGGGVAFGKEPRDFRKGLPRNMRRAALRSAILAKILGNDLMVIDGLRMPGPKTAEMARVLKSLRINRPCLLALAERDQSIYLSSRNIPDLTVRIASELNAFDVATRPKMLVTTEAMRALTQQET